MQYFGFDRPGFSFKTLGFPANTDPDAEIKALFTDGKQGLFLDPSDLSTMFQDEAGTVAVTANGDPLGKGLDKSGNGNHVYQTFSAKRPLFNISIDGYESYKFDGVDDGIASNSITLSDNMDFFIAMRRSNVNSQLIAYGDSITKYFGVLESLSTLKAHDSCGYPSYAVDGVDVNNGGSDTTRGQLNNAVSLNDWHIIEVKNLNLSAWGTLRFGDYGSYSILGDIGGILICQAQTPESRTKIRNYLAKKVGVTL